MPSSHSSQSPKLSNTVMGNSSSVSTKLGFMELPLEVQKGMINHVRSNKDLLSLQRVSSHFHQLASARLYSSLAFLLTHADSSLYYSTWKTRLADVLYVFATSSHDYGQYVKGFSLSMSEKDADDVQKRILSKYHWEEEATKYLNTSLLLMLQKARTLEAFAWDTSIELSGYVYDALSRIESLHDLEIRLDTRAIPRIASFTYSPSQGQLNLPPPPPGQFGQTTQGNFSTSFSTSSSALPMVAGLRKANPNIIMRGSRKFSGFNDLRMLEIYGIDNLDCLHEIAACMTASSTSLKCLRLSLSLDLARKARKPTTPSPPANQTVDPMDDDDDDDLTPPPEPAVVINATPVNEADIKKEKAAQDLVLAKIFGLEPAKTEDKKVDRALKATAASFKTKETPDEIFLEEMKRTMNKLIQSKSVGYKGLLNDKNILKQLEKGVEKYLQSGGHKSKKAKSTTTTGLPKHTSVKHQTILAGPSNASQIAQTEWNLAYKAFQDLLGGDQPTASEFETFMLANAGHLPYTSSFQPPMSYYVDKTPPGLGNSGSSSSAPAYPISQPNHTHSYGSQLSGPNHFQPAGLPSIFQGLGKQPKPMAHSYQHYKESDYEKALQDAEDQAIQEMLLESATKPAEQHQPDPESESDATEDDFDPLSANTDKENTPTVPGPVFPAVIPNPKDQEDDMDVDMEHPDVVESDTDDDQATVTDPNVPPEPRTEIVPAPTTAATASQESLTNGSASSPKPEVKPPSPTKKGILKRSMKKPKTADETMQDYIRAKHGFHLETLSLYLVPLKPSVIGRALDLTCLHSLTLLNVGQQGGFWSFVEKYQNELIPIQLRYIHTDDVSIPFLNCIANISTLQDLFLMRRGGKDSDFTSSAASTTLNNIRILALRKHASTLRKLMIMNNEDDSWDLDAKCLRLLTVKASALTELSFSVHVTNYHVLMQGLRGLKSLASMHILNMRTPEQCQSLARESRKFTIDNITHIPELKIKYLAMDSVVFELARKPSYPRDKKKAKAKGKGKGKEKAEEKEALEAYGDGDSMTDGEENFSDIEAGTLEMACVKHLKFSDLPSVTIFKKEIRTGKL